MIKVFGKNILIKRIMVARKDTIIIPGKEDGVDSGTAEVLHVGDKCEKVKVGDIVAYIFGFEAAVVNGEKFLVGSEDSLYAVLTDDEKGTE